MGEGQKKKRWGKNFAGEEMPSQANFKENNLGGEGQRVNLGREDRERAGKRRRKVCTTPYQHRGHYRRGRHRGV